MLRASSVKTHEDHHFIAGVICSRTAAMVIEMISIDSAEAIMETNLAMMRRQRMRRSLKFMVEEVEEGADSGEDWDIKRERMVEAKDISLALGEAEKVVMAIAW